jgi:rhomboid protease GluP
MDIRDILGLRNKGKGGTIPITYVLIIVNVIVFGVQIFAQNSGVDLIQQFGKINFDIAKHSEYWRLFTAIFLHVSIVHLLVNQFSLYVIGTQVEKLMGRWKFLAIYFASGLFGSLFGFAFDTNNAMIPSVGASGAIFGLLGMMLYYSLMLKKKGYKTSLLPNILFILAINLLFGFSQPGIDNLAHLGGLIGGFAMTKIVGEPVIPSYSNTPNSNSSSSNSVVYVDTVQQGLSKHGLQGLSKKTRHTLYGFGLLLAAIILFFIGNR